MAMTPAPADAAAAAVKKGRILLVDDEPSVLSALRRLFRLNGYETEQATSAADGLELLSTEKFDLVISDMRMPEMDGAAFLELVRNRHPGAVRLLLTGYADIGSTVAAINRGEIHRYIAKPWVDDDLLLIVRDALARRELEQQNQQLLTLTQDQNRALQDLNQNLESKVAARTAELEQINQMLEAAYEEVNAQFTMAVTVFSGLLEMRQDGIAGHARRVGELAKRMAPKLGLNAAEQRDVHLAALLHDIGKIGFPDAMLAKPVSKYSGAEEVRYRRHPIDGEAALMPLDKLHGVALIVRQHHERVDGRGFPEGLYGPSIHMGAKIIATASDYDGLTSGAKAELVYSDAKARDVILAGVNSRYEQRVVTALFAALDDMAAAAVADVELDVTALKPGMKLARDLLSTQGAILLPAGYRFDAAVIKKVTDFAARTNIRLVVRVLLSSVPADAGGKPGAHRSGIAA